MPMSAVTTAHADDGPRGLNIRDLVMFDRISDPRVSPDGDWVAFQLRETDFEANRGVNSLWLRRVKGDEAPRRITAKGGNAVSPRWSADGKSLYFLSNRSGSMQVHRIDVGVPGEARQVTAYPLDVGSFVLAPDGRSIAVAMETYADCKADLACTRKKLDSEAASKQTGQSYDRIFVRHWDSWSDGRRSQLFVAAIGEDGAAAATPVLVSQGIDGDVPGKPFGDDSEIAFAPDGRSIVFAARIAGASEPWSTNHDLFEAPVDGSAAPVNLTDANDASDTGPVFSPDGRTLYYRAFSRPGFEADRYRILARDRASGTTREIAADWDRSAETLMLSRDGRTIYTLANDLGHNPLFAIDVRSGKVTRIAGDGNVAGASIGDDAIVFARDSLAGPANLFRTGLRGGAAVQLTDFNRERLADIRLGAFEQFSFAGAAGHTVYGWVVKPWNFVEGQRYPVAFIVHGGPQSSMGNSFHYRWNAQTYAGAGYAAVFIDFHGSTGYGQAFTDSISGDWGGKPLVDLQKGLAAAGEKYPWLDTGRACALGGSYGGYMISWIAGNWPDGFDCLVNHAGVFDTRAMGYMTEELWFTEWEFGGTVHDAPALYEKWNPANHVKNWKTPMLVLHGELDYRVPYTQGIAAFTAAQRKGIPSQYLHFADENHWILKPHNSIQWHDTVKAWLDRWTRP